MVGPGSQPAQFANKCPMDSLPDIGPFQRRLEELDARMAEPSFYTNPRAAAEVTREQQKLRQMIEDHAALRKAEEHRDQAAALARDPSSDPEMREMAEADRAALEEKVGQLRQAVLLAMMPPEPSDSRNTVMEIRAGTGGEEAALFAGELARVYQRYADSQRWKVEPMSTSSSDRGGLRETAFLIAGTDVYKRLKWESGVHRVQRVPVTEASGRIHTSTVTVAVLPEAEEVDVQIKPEDLEITVARASGPGGQGVNTTDSAVQILHKPTGLIVQCADERSQIKNKARAMTVLRSRLLKLKEDEEKAKYAAERKSQIGSGDRSERIRTYNFPQDRLTDHRIHFTVHGLPQIMDGEIGPVLDAMERAHYEERLAALEGRSFDLAGDAPDPE
jgi:peptide chain release factor 1